MFERVPETCPYRSQSDTGQHYCQLIGDLLADSRSDNRVVDFDTCRACCRSFLPTADDLNPVLASLIWGRSNVVLSQATAEGDSALVERLTRLREFAEASIPLLPVEDDDLPDPPVAPTFRSQLGTDAVEQVLPIPLWEGQKISEWAVGVTCAPRRQPTLDRCVASLCDAGWESPHLFIDGEIELSEACRQLPRTVRLPAANAWKNYYLSLVELTRRSTADALMIVQDDALWPSHLPIRAYLEKVSWPSDGRYLVSPYCCSEYNSDVAGWRKFDGEWHFGAVAFIFSRTAAEEFISDRRVTRYGQKQSAGIDGIVGEWADRNGVPVFVPTPSLVQHIGDVSTLWRTSRASGFRRASRYVGDEITGVNESAEST